MCASARVAFANLSINDSPFTCKCIQKHWLDWRPSRPHSKSADDDYTSTYLAMGKTSAPSERVLCGDSRKYEARAWLWRRITAPHPRQPNPKRKQLNIVDAQIVFMHAVRAFCFLFAFSFRFPSHILTQRPNNRAECLQSVSLFLGLCLRRRRRVLCCCITLISLSLSLSHSSFAYFFSRFLYLIINNRIEIVVKYVRTLCVAV